MTYCLLLAAAVVALQERDDPVRRTLYRIKK